MFKYTEGLNRHDREGEIVERTAGVGERGMPAGVVQEPGRSCSRLAIKSEEVSSEKERDTGP